MATFRIETPEGNYKIEAPEGTTDAQAYQYLQESLGNPYEGYDSQETVGEGYQYESEDTGVVRDVADIATGLVSGTAKAAGAIVGLGSLVKGLHYIADPLSAWLQKGGEAIDEALLSDRQQEINQELSTRLQAAAGELGPDASTEDYLEAIVSQGGEAGAFVADHPGQVLNLIATSVPYIFGGGAITKGVKHGAEALGLKKVSEMGGITGAAVGEGAITSGEVTKNIIEKTGTSGEYSTDRLAAIPAGLGTAGISLLSGRIANKGGIADIDTAITNRIAGTSTDLMKESTKGGVRKTAEGAVVEGGEELLQGAQEKVFENLGTGEHLLTDVGGEAVMGAFAGAGQGAGINAIKSLSGSDVELTQAQKEANAVIEAEQAQALEDDAFISEAMAIHNTESNVEFHEKWAEQLGVTTEEVANDPRFGLVRQQQEELKQEKITKTRRRKAAESFPDEKDWEKENAADMEQRQRLDIANENSDLGAAFVIWQEENEQYDTNDGVVNDFLSDPANQELLPELDDSREPYFAALDAHANFKDVEVNRTPEEQAQVEATTAPLIDALNTATSEKNLGGIAAVEQAAREQLDPAEWSIAKRNNAGPKKGRKAAKGKEGGTPPGDATPGGVPPINPLTQMGQSALAGPHAPTNPFTQKHRKAAWDKAVSIYGPNFEAEHPDLKELLHATPESKKFSSAAVNKLLDGKQNTDKAQSVGTAAELFQYIAEDTSGNYTENQKKVARVLLEAARNNTLDGYFDLEGKGSWEPTRVAKEAGLKSRQSAEQVIEQLETNIAKFHGEEALANIRMQTQASVNAKNLINEASTGETYEGGSQEYGGGASALEISEMGIVKRASDTTSDTGALNTGEKNWVDSKAEREGAEETKEKIKANRKEQQEVVDTAMSSNMDAHQIRKEWERSKPEGAESFDELSTPAKYSWINSWITGGVHLWKADAAEINKKFSKQEGDVNAETDKGAAKESGSTDTEKRADTGKDAEGGRKSDEVGADASKEARDATDEINEIAEAYAAEKLGAKWATKHKQLPIVLRSKGANAFSKKVDAILRAEKKAEKLAKEEGFAKAKAEAKARKKQKAKEDANPKAVQKLIDNADKTLGDDWMMEHPKLMEMLAQKKFGAFEKEVSKLAAKDAAVTKESISPEQNNAIREHFARKNKDKRKAFDKILATLFGNDVPKHVADHFHVVDSVSDLRALFPKGEFSDSVGGVYTRLGAQEDVVFVLDGIEAGEEMALFMHEVGGHLGLDNLFSAMDVADVVGRIKAWADGDPTFPLQKDGSLHPRDPALIAAKALDRANMAAAGSMFSGTPFTAKDLSSEIIAYFLQEAVNAGYKPTATKLKGSVEEVVALIKRTLNKALKKFGVNAKGLVDITTLDLVNVAFGAAQRGLSEMGTKGRNDMLLGNTTRESISPKKNKKDISNTRKVIKTLFPKKGIQHWETFSHAMKRASDETKFLHSFIEENKIKMPSAGKWFDLILKAEEVVNKIKRHVEGVAVQAREMSDERLTIVNKFLADSTLKRAWGYDPKFKGKKVKVDKDMSKRFNALRDSEQELVRNIFAHGNDMLLRKRAIAKAKGVSDKFFQTGVLDGPYAPLKRFGNYVTTLKSEALLKAEKAYKQRPIKVNKIRLDNLRGKEAHYVIKFFDTIGAANAFKNQKEALYASATAVDKAAEFNEGSGSNQKVLSKVLGTMKSANLDPEAYKSMEALVQEMYMSSLDENNARQSQAKRVGVAGFDDNMVRSFLAHSRAEANLISQMENGSDIAAALVEAKLEAKADPEKLVPVYNMLVSHYTSMLDGKETPIQNAVAAFNTVWMLTSSVGYHFTNATQPLMVTVPVLAAVFGDYKGTMKALLPMFGTGYQVARDVVTFKKQNDKFFHRQAEVDFKKLDPKYHELFKALQDRKLLDVGMEQDLAEFTRMDTGSEALNKASGAASDVTHRLYQAARVVEMYNRVSTAVAAHDMAMKKPGKIKHMGMDPVQFALKIVQDTQGDFSNTDAPRVLKRVPKLLGQYRKYQFMMGWVYANATKAAFSGATKEEKAVGRKTLQYMLMHAGIFGGVRGLPFIGLVASTFSLFSGGEEPEDIERLIHEYVGDKDLANLISRGLPSVLGIDMSTKLSQDKIFYPAPFVDFEASQEGLRDAAFGFFLGPTANTASNVIRSVEFASEGNAYRSIETAMPKGIKTIMESYRLGTEGYSTRNGDIVADASQFNKLSLVANALGIPAADVSKLKWTYGQQFELKEYFGKEQQSIRERYVKAKNAGDDEKVATIKDEWRALQDAKDGVRPFFNDYYKALKRTSIKSLIMAPYKQRRREKESRRVLGTD